MTDNVPDDAETLTEMLYEAHDELIDLYIRMQSARRVMAAYEQEAEENGDMGAIIDEVNERLFG